MDKLDPALLVDPALSTQSSQTMGPAPAGAHIGSSDDEDDPVVGTFNILLKPTLTANRKILVLEHPNKSDGLRPARAPLELRTKPATGMLELDFPVDYNSGYDRTKGLNWGTNLHKSTEAKKGGSHGLAGGFGFGAPPPRARAGARGDEILDLSMDWNEALRKDYVLRTQTMGGQTPDVGAESKYMVGVFAGSNLHLTPASSLVHLRPQLHYIDATTEQERLTRGGGAVGAAATKEAARAIHMTIKQTKDGDEEIVQETMADRLRKVQTEGWRRMRYVHEEAADSWAVSEEALYLRGRDEPGKQPESVAAAVNEHGVAELAEQVAALRTGMDEDGMLERTSGIRKERPVKVEISDDEPAAPSAKAKGKGKATDTGSSSKPTGHAKTTAAAAAATRGKKANAPTNNTAIAGPSARAKKNDS